MRIDPEVMELILWRHADAGDPLEDRQADLQRPLSARGRKQAQRMAQWLLARLPSRYVVLTSPAVRAVQTARALSDKAATDTRLLPGASGDDILAAVNWPGGPEGRIRHCVVVGHQPSLGEAAALALTGGRYPLALRKGALLRLATRPGEPTRAPLLRGAIGPDLL